MLTYHFSSSFWIIRHTGNFQVPALMCGWGGASHLCTESYSSFQGPLLVYLTHRYRAGEGGLITFMNSRFMTQQTAKTLQEICNSSILSPASAEFCHVCHISSFNGKVEFLPSDFNYFCSYQWDYFPPYLFIVCLYQMDIYLLGLCL